MSGRALAAKPLKIGIVCEGQRGCAETQVFPHLVKLLCPRASLEVVPTGNRPMVLAQAPKVAKQLLSQGCTVVFVMWDVFPEWPDDGGSTDCKVHCSTLATNLTAAAMGSLPIIPVAVHRMLEAWLLCDADAITKTIGPLVKKKPIPHEANPDGVDAPKTALRGLFKLGRGTQYNESFSAQKIAAKLTTVKRLEKSQSFKHFADKVRDLCASA